MKLHASLLILAFTLVAAGAESRPANDAAIKEVTAGKRKVARAAWWGFDPADATASLQAAINSGAKRVIVENLGAPWVVNKIQLASDQELFFEKGTVVLAKRGAFHGNNDSLFTASLKKNVTLTGYGATLKMWKLDYDSKDYTHAEWRNVLTISSCSNVRVAGLTLADSGGDGIYLGVAKKGVPNSDVVIKDVACVNNYRQGISVISARNLLIENCVLKDTWGTAPQAGIDFEPNHESEELVNCVMRNCISENNRGDGYTFYLPALRADSAKLSIRLENCRSRGCRQAICFITGNGDEQAAVGGTAEFINCKLEGSQQSGLMVGSKPVTGCQVSFVNCQVLNAATNQLATPVTISTRSSDVSGTGGIRFDNCTISDPLNRLPMSFQDMAGGLGLRDVTGTLIVKHAGKRTVHQLDQKLIDTWMPHPAFKDIKPFAAKGVRYEPVLVAAQAAARKSAVRQREHAEYLLWTESGQRPSFTVRIGHVGKGGAKRVPVRLVSPSGKTTALADVAAGEEAAYAFAAEETGAYKIICEPGGCTAQVNSASHRVCLYAERAVVHFLGTTGEFFFWVPAGTSEFAIKVSGDNAAERVKAALFDPAGMKKEEQDSIAQAHQFVVERADASRGEVWSLRLDRPSQGVLEDFRVQLQGIPPLLAASRESLLRPSK